MSLHNLVLLTIAASGVAAYGQPGKLVAMPWGKMHLHCTGKGSPTIVIEQGFGDFSFTWARVQTLLSKDTRVCTYDRAGYAWSDPGPQPRTLAQLNLELHELLRHAGIRPPFVLAGHSFGGNPVRNYADQYRGRLAGIILIDAVHGDQQIRMGKDRLVRLRELATGKKPPPPSLATPVRAGTAEPAPPPQPLPPPFDQLPEPERSWFRDFSNSPLLAEAQRSEGSWSEEALAEWHRHPQSFGDLPLLVISRAKANESALENERVTLQESLASLSNRGLVVPLPCGHNMHLECPGTLAKEIRKFAAASRNRR